MKYSVDRYNCSRKIMVITNMGCNLDCIYCYEHKKDSKTAFNLEETTTKLAKILKKETPNGTLIKLLGGEPFLVFPKIKQLCESIWEQQISEKLLFHATSNGTLIHEKIKDWLFANRFKFTVKLSLDGNKEAQEINRPGSFDKIDFDFFKATWPDVGIKMTISPKSIRYFAESIKFFHTNGFITIQPNFAEFVDWSPNILSKTFYQQMMSLVDFYIENPQYTPCKYLRMPIRRILDKHCVFHNCTLGEREIFDYQTGKCYPCMFFLPSICGKEKSEEMLRLDMTCKNNLLEGACCNCIFNNICTTCYAANYMKRGSSSKRDMSLCKMKKITFLASAKLLINKYVKNRISIPNTKEGYEIYKDIEAISKNIEQFQKIEKEYE